MKQASIMIGNKDIAKPSEEEMIQMAKDALKELAEYVESQRKPNFPAGGIVLKNHFTGEIVGLNKEIRKGEIVTLLPKNFTLGEITK